MQVEIKTGRLFSSLWERLNKQQFEESVDLFFKRAEANNFDWKELGGKKILDAGCGSGRYAIALARCGAAKVTAIDISPEAIRLARERASAYSNVFFQTGSVLDLPFKNKTFDFVWCAGVLHHTRNSNLGLSEITRVLKPGGKLFLLLYGRGGHYWAHTLALRPLLQEIGKPRVEQAMINAGLPANKRKHFLDNFFVPLIEFTTYREIESILRKIGYGKFQRWQGETFDHESKPSKALEDLQQVKNALGKLPLICKEKSHQSMARLALALTDETIKEVKKILCKQDEKECRKIIIGSGCIRLLCQKKQVK